MRITLTALSALLLCAASHPVAQRYELRPSIPGPDGQGWDFASFDPTSGRVFVAHGNAVTVVEHAHGDVARSIGAISHGHAVVPLPHGELAVTSGGDNTVRLLDVTSGRQLASIPVGDDPDAALIDPVTKHLLTMNAHSGTVSEVDLGGRKVLRTLTLKKGLEYPVIAKRTLYVNNEDENEIETVNLATGRAGSSIVLDGCEGPTGLAFDKVHHRLITACANGVAEVVDVDSQAVVQKIAIGKGPDDVLIHDRRRVALIPCGRSGTLEVLSLSGTRVVKVATVTTEAGARTGTVDERTGTVFLPAVRYSPPQQQGERPTAIPGSFHLVALKPKA